jgi:hypothetical protein
MIRRNLSEITKRMFGKTFNDDVNLQAAALDRALLGSKDTYEIGGFSGIKAGIYPPKVNLDAAVDYYTDQTVAPYDIVTDNVTLDLQANVDFYLWNPYTGDLKSVGMGEELHLAPIVYSDGRGEIVLDYDHYLSAICYPDHHGPSTIDMSGWSNNVAISDYERCGMLADADLYDNQHPQDTLYLLIVVGKGEFISIDSRFDYRTKGQTIRRDLCGWNNEKATLAQELFRTINLETGYAKTLKQVRFGYFTVFREGAPDWYIHFKMIVPNNYPIQFLEAIESDE